MRYLFYALIVLSLIQCQTEKSDANYSLIPYPDAIEKGSGYFMSDSIYISQSETKALELIASFGHHQLNILSTGIENQVQLVFEKSADSNIRIEVASDQIKGTYNTDRDKSQIIRTLAQLSILNNGKIPLGKITQKANFDYRGMHLDVCRHMYSVDDVKKYIDYLYFYGYNKFHWHLTEDQGWRIEIKQFPKLQSIAAFRDETLIGHYNDNPQRFDGRRYGGFYNQEEIKDVVSYAALRGIDVIPEIELPGHSLAALSAYPELSCNPDKEYKAATKWGVFEDIYCPTEATFEFLEKVFDEVISLFPYEYIHIGGDEAPKTVWNNSPFCQNLIKELGLKDSYELQSYFINRIEKYLNSKGKQIIGWDEILEGGLAPNATVMSWRGEEGGIEAAKQNHKVVMTPTSHCYFDYYQSEREDEPLAIGGYVPLEKVYNYKVIPEALTSNEAEYVWGAQGNVWTEYMKEFSQVEYMALARMTALSEILWTDEAERNYQEYVDRLSHHIGYWQNKNVNIANHLLDLNADITSEYNKGTSITKMFIPEGSSTYAQRPGATEWQPLDKFPFYFSENGTYSFYASKDGKAGNPLRMVYEQHKGNFSKIELVDQPAEKYSGRGASSLINGIYGSSEKYGDSEWLGFEGKDLDCTIEFPEVQNISKISLRFYKGEGQWIYLPKSIGILVSDDGVNFTQKSMIRNLGTQKKIMNVNLDFQDLKGKYLRVFAQNYGKIPDGNQGAGHDAWLFVDEIIIN